MHLNRNTMDKLAITTSLQIKPDSTYPEIFKDPNTLQRVRGDKPRELELMVRIWINEFQGAYNVSSKMDKPQIVSAAKSIVEQFYFLTLNDLSKFFSTATSGLYGQVFNRVDLETICRLLDKYCEARTIAREDYEKAQKQKHADKPLTDEERELGLKYIAILKEKLKPKRGEQMGAERAKEGQLYFQLERVWCKHSRRSRRRFAEVLPIEEYFGSIGLAKRSTLFFLNQKTRSK